MVQVQLPSSLRLRGSSVLLLLAFARAGAFGNLYSVSYEGDQYPELSNPPWQRELDYGGGIRTINGGEFSLDTRGDAWIYDYYRIDRQMDPAPGELFVASWRVKIVDAWGYVDTGIAFAPDRYGTLDFGYYMDHMVSDREHWSLPIAPGVYHTYRIESADMYHYGLWIDDQFARNGLWDLNSLNHSFVGWGDENEGAGGSLAVWDYVRFSVVPEPCALVLAAAVIVCQRGRRGFGRSACPLNSRLRAPASSAHRITAPVVLVLVFACAGAFANLYSVSYEGDQFPELSNPIWQRFFDHGGGVRSIEDGAFSLDTRADPWIYDGYKFDRQIDPAPGELFVASWRVKVVDAFGYMNTGIGFAPDRCGTLEFSYYMDRVVSEREHWSLPIEPAVYHTYRIESADMYHYELWVDDQYARDGLWDLNSLNQSFVAWGDLKQEGGGSLAIWDYVRFSVVPEPPALVLAAAVLVCQRRQTRVLRERANGAVRRAGRLGSRPAGATALGAAWCLATGTCFSPGEVGVLTSKAVESESCGQY